MAAEEESPLPPNTRNNLTGWAAIENYLQKHDSSMVKGYADDIDTLLVFAGLFSAVLTAFVVETYPMLQQDSAAVTNLLLQGISSKIDAGQGTGTSAAIAPYSFTPSTAARWVNILFFLSLVFSLSAALFGILAKQWLREFMQWNSTLGSPRENVLIRQIRFEAGQAWNIAATISSIPALLEVAMVLFLSGVVILLWTIDTVVASVVTVTVVAFMGAVSAFTILPVFFRRCPYKSPTAWACVVLSDYLFSIAQFCIRFGLEYARNLRRGLRYWRFNTVKLRWVHRPRDWRQRDRSSYLTGESGGLRVGAASRGARESLVQAIETEMIGLREDGTPVDSANGSRSLAVVASIEAMKDLSESSLLFRALAWVQQASQDVSLRPHIVESLSSLHADIVSEDVVGLAIKTVSDWCLLWSLQTRNLEQPDAGLTKVGNEVTGVLAVQRQVRDLWAFEYVAHGHANIVMRARQRALYGIVHLRVANEHSSTLLFADLVAVDLYAAVNKLRAGGWSFTSGRLVLELLCVLSTICTGRNLPASSTHLRGIQALIGDSDMKLTLDTMCPGLRSSAFMIACRLGRVECDNGVITVAAPSSMGLVHITRLICSYFARDIQEYGPEDIHIFILLVNEWLLHLSPQPGLPESPYLIDSIWKKMSSLVRFSLRAKLRNCGCFFDLPWPHRLFAMYHNYLPVLSGGWRHAYLRLLHLLDRANNNGLLTGPHTAVISDLLGLSHKSSAVLCVEHRCKFHADTATLRSNVEDILGTSVNYSQQADRPLQPVRLTRRPRELPLTCLRNPVTAILDVSAAMDYAFDAFNGVLVISRAEVAAYVNIWQWSCDPAAGFHLAESNIIPVLASLPTVLFSMIYPKEYSVHSILEQSDSRRIRDTEQSNGAVVIDGVNIALLQDAAGRIDRRRLRQRKNMFIWFYHRSLHLSRREHGLSFTDMVELLVDHLTIQFDDATSLHSLLQKHESDQEVVQAIENDRIRSLLTMIVLRRRFLAARRDRTSQRLLSH